MFAIITSPFQYELLGPATTLEYFAVDENTGRVTVKKPLSGAPTGSFTVVARAFDAGQPPKDDITTFFITTDQNQHDPVIEPLTYSETINETLDPGEWKLPSERLLTLSM